MWGRFGKRFDRRAKKNTDLIKVKYALPAMWVIILDLCINPSLSRSHRASYPREPPPARPLSSLTPYGFPCPRTSSGIHLRILPSRACIPLILRANLDSFSVYFQRRIKLIPGARIRTRVITINSIHRWNYNETLKRGPVIQPRLENFSGTVLE